MLKTMEASKAELEELEEKLNGLVETHVGMDIHSRTGISPETKKLMDDYSSSINEVIENIERVGGRAGITVEKLKALDTSMKKTHDMPVFDFAAQAEEAQAYMAAMESTINNLYAQMETKKEATAIVALKHDIQAAEQALASFESKLENRKDAITDELYDLTEKHKDSSNSALDERTIKLANGLDSTQRQVEALSAIVDDNLRRNMDAVHETIEKAVRAASDKAEEVYAVHRACLQSPSWCLSGLFYACQRRQNPPIHEVLAEPAIIGRRK